MLKPKIYGDRKGQASFIKAKGRGSVELKSLDGYAAPTLCFWISLGGGAPRGPFTHDFSNSTVAGAARSEDIFDFASAVDSTSSTLLVSLEVMPILS